MFQLLYKACWLILLLIFFLGCASTPQKKEPRTDEEFFNRAMEYYKNKDTWQGIPAFQEIRDKFPLSKYAVLAELRLADLHYFKGEYIEAIHYYEEFKRLHPSNPQVPYVVFQLGMSYFKQMETIDRDQTPAENAASYFEYLINHYSSSPFTGMAMGKLKICKRMMFDHDFYIGNFYYKSKKYLAAQERFLEILAKYPYVRERDKVIFYLAQTYQQLSKETKARETFSALLKDYPQSDYCIQAKHLLGIPLEPEEAEKLEMK